MSVTIKLNSVFLEYTHNQEIVDVTGHTVSECLDSLISLFPDMKGVLFDPQGGLSALIIFHGETILPNALNMPVEETSELVILPLIYGG